MERASDLKRILDLMRQCAGVYRYLAKKEFSDGERIELDRLAALIDEVNRRTQVMIDLLENENGAAPPPTMEF